ncbi:ribose-phosphate pyrophosphokinase [Nocardiopsis sp. EMB25]|uniref:ribose-phosphate diphosphokinase n=1 Tax=Nocardiopsis sp. EMB25 TaxID=2835867 RepID=UPI0022843085|nr:ribose-phosphate pyrophosphokinase [Nocardiopsis sp. EMB25]MCY9783531.1 ribose-phosphate pyrophosphokinase [Nocardiopsis sp. EMB25]
MSTRIVSGTAHRTLAEAVASALDTELAACGVERFPDGELRPVVERVRGDDVYVVQPTGPPVGEHLVELLLLLDACRRGGARTSTAVVPYFGYARQDRRGRAGEAVGSRVVADTLASAGADRLVVVDPHTVALEAMCAMPVEMLTSVPVLADALAEETPDTAVVVAPDLGAVKLAEHHAGRLGLPVAVVRKRRLSGETVQAGEVAGEVVDRPAVVVDDMISTGGTIEAAVDVLLAHGALADVTVAATHGLLVGTAHDRLERLPIRRLFVTDTLPGCRERVPRVRVCSVAPLLADAIGRLRDDEPLDALMVRG